MQGQNILRTLIFVVFLSIGGAAMSGAILLDVILQKYNQKKQLTAEKVNLQKLKSLNDDYDAVINWLEEDPNRIERLVAPTFSSNRNDVNTAYPRPSPEQLNAARKALTEDMEGNNQPSSLPEWINRCNEPDRRLALFLAGAALVLIAFIFFGRKTPAPAKQKTN